MGESGASEAIGPETWACCAFVCKKSEEHYLLLIRSENDSRDGDGTNGGTKRIGGIHATPPAALHALVEHLQGIQLAMDTAFVEIEIDIVSSKGQPFTGRFKGALAEVVADPDRIFDSPTGDEVPDVEDEPRPVESESEVQTSAQLPVEEPLTPEQKKEQEFKEKIELALRYGYKTTPTEWVKDVADRLDDDDGVLLSKLLVAKMAEVLKAFKENPRRALVQRTQDLFRLMEIVEELRSRDLCLYLASSPVLILLFFCDHTKGRKAAAETLFQRLIDTLQSMPEKDKHRLDVFWSFVATTKGTYVDSSHVSTALTELCRAHAKDRNLRPAVSAFADWLDTLPWTRFKGNREDISNVWGIIKTNGTNSSIQLWELGEEYLPGLRSGIMRAQIARCWAHLLKQDRISAGAHNEETDGRTGAQVAK